MSDLEMRAMKTEIFAIKNRRCFLNGRSRVSRSVSHDFEFLQVRSRSARLRYTLFTRLTCLRLITDLFYQCKSFDSYISDSLCNCSADCLTSLKATRLVTKARSVSFIRQGGCPVFVFSNALESWKSQRYFSPELI